MSSGFRRGVNEMFAVWDVTRCSFIVTAVSGQLIGPMLKSFITN